MEMSVLMMTSLMLAITLSVSTPFSRKYRSSAFRLHLLPYLVGSQSGKELDRSVVEKHNKQSTQTRGLRG